MFEFKRPINRYNVDNDYNSREELVESFISESNSGISVFIARTEPKILNFTQSFSTERRNWAVVERSTLVSTICNGKIRMNRDSTT
jgi:hypothetical protein